MSDDGVSRRAVLGGVAGAAAASLAGCAAFESGDDADTAGVDDGRARELAERFAPALFFDSAEQWFPTDPRSYERQRDGETVVDGFAALEGYTEAGDGGQPPEPTVFYNAVTYAESPLTVVQFWLYSAFDQFSTNFHWHDWELLQVFVDTDTGDPQLYVASSHSRSVPNNEFLDPDPDRRPRLLSELGSHSSGLSVNDVPDRFQRFPLDDTIADITNSALEGVEDAVEIPLAYGLPRDEGLALPYVVPELDGRPVYEDDRLPAVGRGDLLPAELTVRSLEGLSSPPSDLPTRETGLQFDHEDRETGADVGYSLEPTADLEHIDDFTGPQLSFEFAVPGVAEDAVADHITTTGVPWEDPRYEAPASDITEARHRSALAERYDAIGEPSTASRVLVAVTEAVSNDDAPEGEGLETTASPLELFALLESEPAAVPTFRGVAAVQGVETGEHRLTVNGAGVAPHSETVAVEGETTVAGVEGEIPTVARENATKVEVDPTEAAEDLRRLAVEDDFAGRLYDAPLTGPDAVYVHRGGAFTAELRDADDERGAFRVNPDAEDRVRVENPRTGTEPLASYLADLAEETRAEVAAVAGDGDEDDDDDRGGSGGAENAVRGLERALAAVAEAARRAADRAGAGDRGGADRALTTVVERLDTLERRLEAARGGGLPADLGRASANRLDQARRRADQARDAETL